MTESNTDIVRPENANPPETPSGDWDLRLVRPLCDGRCAARHECQGDVKRVHVLLGSKEWGWFNYCDEARAEDKSNGYTVMFENVCCSQCGNDFGQGEHGFSHCSDHSPKGQCADCKWSMEKEDRYDQVHCCCDESPNAWGDVEAADSCSYFLPNSQDQERR